MGREGGKLVVSRMVGVVRGGPAKARQGALRRQPT